MLDNTKGMFHPGPAAVTLPVKRPICTAEPLAPSRLAVHPPVNAPGNGCLSAPRIDIRLVPLDDGLLTMQTVRHHRGIMHGSMRHRHTVYPALRVRADMRLHTDIPGIALSKSVSPPGPAAGPGSSSNSAH